MPTSPGVRFRLDAATLAKLDAIGRAFGGMDRTNVLRMAIEALYSAKFPGQPAPEKSGE